MAMFWREPRPHTVSYRCHNPFPSLPLRASEGFPLTLSPLSPLGHCVHTREDIGDRGQHVDDDHLPR